MLKISNKEMRLLWLQSNFLLNTKNEKIDVLQIIKDLWFVQIDSIQNVTRAQHHILWSRNNQYKEYMLDELLLEKWNVFEHFTHDASILPVEFYPIWKWHFKRIKDKIDKTKYYKDILWEEEIEKMLHRFKKEGALHSQDFNNKSWEKKTTWAGLYKATLDYIWYCWVLTTAHRKKFRKYYDLSENIIPKDIFNKNITNEKQIDLLCHKALNILTIATAKEIRNFWGSLSIQEVNDWIKDNKDKLKEIEWENNEWNYVKSFSVLNVEKKLEEIKNINNKIQIINPFDPAIRDRVRFKRIFDFDYKIEIFVPKEKRIYWYYVYPILQWCDFIWRIEIKADRKSKQMNILNFWREDWVKWDEKQQEKLDKELLNLAQLVDIEVVNWLK